MGLWLPAEQGLCLGVGWGASSSDSKGSPGRSQKPTFLPLGLAFLWVGVHLFASLSFDFKAVKGNRNEKKKGSLQTDPSSAPLAVLGERSR